MYQDVSHNTDQAAFPTGACATDDRRLEKAASAFKGSGQEALNVEYVVYPPDKFHDRYPCWARNLEAKYARCPTPQ